MGYTTYFNGTVKIEPQLTDELKNYLNKFAEVRHMKRDNVKLHERFKNQVKKDEMITYAHGLDGQYGVEGEYFIGGEGDYGQMADSTVVNQNEPPSTQPDLWCQWIVNDNNELEWDDGEKFYNAGEWMTYLVNKILAPRGYTCNGEIFADGESSDDFWKIVVKDNEVVVYDGHIIYEDHHNYSYVKEAE